MVEVSVAGWDDLLVVCLGDTKAWLLAALTVAAMAVLMAEGLVVKLVPD